MPRTNALRAVLLAFVALSVGTLACGSSPTTYRVVVRFNTTVAQTDMDAVAGYLRNFDQGLDFLVQESFPPTGVATVRTNAKHFCPKVEAELEGRPYIDGVDCHRASDVTSSKSPDAPVSSTP